MIIFDRLTNYKLCKEQKKTLLVLIPSIVMLKSHKLTNKQCTNSYLICKYIYHMSTLHTCSIYL